MGVETKLMEYEMITKTQQAKTAFENKDWKNCFKILKGFRAGVSKKERSTLAGGYEAYTHPDFYIQLGKNPENMIEEAKVVASKLLA